MYLRYREQSWESSDTAETPQSRRRAGAGTRGDLKRTPGPGGAVARKSMPIVDLLGVRLHAITERQSINHILDELDAGRGGVVVTPNLDHLRRYLADVNFRALVAEADLVVPDGMPLVWASRLQGTPLPERVAGSNLISTLSGGGGGAEAIHLPCWAARQWRRRAGRESASGAISQAEYRRDLFPAHGL